MSESLRLRSRRSLFALVVASVFGVLCVASAGAAGNPGTPGRSATAPGQAKKASPLATGGGTSVAGAAAVAAPAALVPTVAMAPGADVRLTNDFPGGGYTSSYTLATGVPYTDEVLATCSVSRGRQNEPSVGVDPRDTRVVIGSSNDYCGAFPVSNPASASGPIWLGYYRSENSGGSFTSSLVPGYPGDTSPFSTLVGTRTASAGDPVIAWDAEGRVFLGSESSDDPAGTAKSFGDVFVARYVNPAEVVGGPVDTRLDGKYFAGSTIVSRGSSAPNLLGVFNDKTAIAADHNSDGRCDNNVYFSYSRFTGQSPANALYFSRSTDHGGTFSHVQKITAGTQNVQFPDIAVTGNDNVYVFFRQFATQSGQPDAVSYVRSTDCGQTFTRPVVLQTFTPYDAQDVSDPEPVPAAAPTAGAVEEEMEAERDEAGNARDCGDFDSHCQSGYTFFRRDTQVRATADQFATGANADTVYVVYDPTKPGTEVDTGTTYGSIQVGRGSQSGVYFLAVNGATGAKTLGPQLIDQEAVGHQLFPDISADHGSLHALWWDSRNDPAYSPARPVGNDSSGHVYDSLDVYASSSTEANPAAWTPAVRISDRSTNPNYEQFGGRTVPFAGDYLWIDSVGAFSYGVWTDWRDTVAGIDQREIAAPDEDDTTAFEFPTNHSSADVLQCRAKVDVTDKKGNVIGQTYGPDTCPFSGGLDQNIYGDYTP
jgi:hypothetical protein